MINKSYVLITAARNEENYIEKTIQAVVAQTILPEKWVIVSDGSTDRTDAIVGNYALRYDFIKLLSLSQDSQRNFGAKVKAINAGYALLRDAEYECIGFVDADITFEPQYYEKILARFQENPRLGIAGGIILERRGDRFQRLDYNLKSVAGAIQLFRRQCYAEIGGYMPLHCGGIDAVAEVLARRHGWEVKTFPEICVHHHRRIGMSKGSLLNSKFRYGVRDNLIGTHPLFMIGKCVKRFREQPYILGSLAMLAGYFCSLLRREVRPVGNEFVNYIRREQRHRMGPAFLKIKKHAPVNSFGR